MKKFFLVMFLAAGLLTTQAQKTSTKFEINAAPKDQQIQMLADASFSVVQTGTVLEISTDEASLELEITSSQGNVVWSGSWQPGTVISVEGWLPGSYFAADPRHGRYIFSIE